jgi:hypothetical protein
MMRANAGSRAPRNARLSEKYLEEEQVGFYSVGECGVYYHANFVASTTCVPGHTYIVVCAGPQLHS